MGWWIRGEPVIEAVGRDGGTNSLTRATIECNILSDVMRNRQVGEKKIAVRHKRLLVS
jgi:hypothetical protein